MNILDTFQARHLFEDMTSPGLAKALDKPLTVYAGFDPTSDSLQAGNFVTIMALAHLQRAGHRVIALVGGATGLIGDPSGKSKERNLLSAEQVERNLVGIRENLSRFLDFSPDSANPAILVNNYDWFKDFTFIDLLRDVGRYFRMGVMLGKDSVKKRMESDDGMSFTEFCYQILQGYDFYHLYKTYGCALQIGGSDQWGNITAGTELVRRICGEEVYGMTFPLVCDSTGKKFGKSEGNAIFLDARKTSYYDFYQFFLRTLDADVIRYLKIFTFLPFERIAELEAAVMAAPEKREAQQVLAEELTRAVHGESGLAIARKATGVLFGGAIEGLAAAELEAIFANVPSATLSADQVLGKPAFEVVAAAGMAASKGEARRLVQQGGLYINNARVMGIERAFGASDLCEGRLAVLRGGKKSFFLLKVR
ncbi:MAG: tyrosine--tRNA ligase [Kiritimatiellia bacterium]|jgi:tyrosyl-tRNA synthetase|nr:tyrosine--tRNA ligase [Kiritimatiellia bacterium]